MGGGSGGGGSGGSGNGDGDGSGDGSGDGNFSVYGGGKSRSCKNGSRFVSSRGDFSNSSSDGGVTGDGFDFKRSFKRLVGDFEGVLNVRLVLGRNERLISSSARALETGR